MRRNIPNFQRMCPQRATAGEMHVNFDCVRKTTMAEIGVVLLDIQKIPNNLGAVVEVFYTVTFNEADLSANRVFEEVVELIGAEDGFLNTRDEAIRFGRGNLPFFTSTIRANGETSTPVRHVKEVQRSDLDEDRPGRDEIRARVSFTATGAGQVVRESNLVVDDFRAGHA
jgi:hypothetical protein